MTTTAFLELTKWAADQVGDPEVAPALDADDETGIEWRWVCDQDWTPLRSFVRLAEVIAARVMTHALQLQTAGQPVGAPWAQCAIVTDADGTQVFLVELGVHGPAPLPRVVCTPGKPGRERQVRAYPAEWSMTGTAPAVQAHLIPPEQVAELLWDWMTLGLVSPGGFSTEPALPGRHRARS